MRKLFKAKLHGLGVFTIAQMMLSCVSVSDILKK